MWLAAAELTTAETVTFHVVTDLLWHALAARPSDTARGVVIVKTLHKSYPEIDFETGLQKLDGDGNKIFLKFDYRYVYVRMYAAGGNADKQGKKLAALYADRGMGKGGSGGIVAAALDADLITKNDVLDAWHAGADGYQKFIDHCKSLIEVTQLNNG